MCSARDNVALPTLGFPIRASAGQWLFSASPRLIAAVHALLRLLVPRHPPCALTILTVIGEKSWRTFPLEKSLRISPGVSPDSSRSEKCESKRRKAFTRFLQGKTPPGVLPDTRVIGYCAVFKVREEAQLGPGSSGLSPRAPARAGLSKLNSMRAASQRASARRRAACQVRSTLLGRSLEAIAAH
jgi:hypothetical protein